MTLRRMVSELSSGGNAIQNICIPQSWSSSTHWYSSSMLTSSDFKPCFSSKFQELNLISSRAWPIYFNRGSSKTVKTCHYCRLNRLFMQSLDTLLQLVKVSRLGLVPALWKFACEAYRASAFGKNCWHRASAWFDLTSLSKVHQLGECRSMSLTGWHT